MTFEIQVEKSKLLDMLEAIGVIADEATFDVDKEAWRFRSMDPSHICLIDINHPLNQFQEADVQDTTRFGIKIDDAAKIVKRFDDKDVLTVTGDEDAYVVIKTKEKEYRLRMIDASASEQKLPKMESDVKLETTWATINDAIKDIAVVSEEITIEAIKGGKAFFKGKGDSGEVVRNLAEGWENKGEGKATFSLDYISKAVTAVKHAEGVKLEYSSKMPLKLSFAGRYIAYYLAPRVRD